jgi:PAS domain S-box-containing protein
LGLLNKHDIVTNFEAEIRRRDNAIIWISMNVRLIRDPGGNITLLEGTIADITERKQTEQELRKSEEKFRNLFDNALEGVYRTTPEGLIISANMAFARIFGYESPEEISKMVTDIGHQLYVNPEERQTSIQILRETGSLKNFECQMRRKDDSIFWVSMNAQLQKSSDGISILEGFIADINDRKQSEEKLKDTLESLRKAVNTTIQVMVSAVEVRDPYTAGHQFRSADLARAIATEIGLSQEKIDGIRMAGSIHDIGKLSIPAEILSKPTKLTNLEFSLIKEHSRSGYEMLKDVESLWPLAQIVYQHHERMDGSGYPRNLKGDEILMEARIMAVADVVESMASHRPYRPALGIDAALEEIEKNRGTIYDDAAADACLRLFREKGFQLQGARF